MLDTDLIPSDTVVAGDALAHGADWDIPRPAATCRHLLAAARLHGIDAADCLAGTGLSVADISDSATEVQAGQELRIVRNVLACVDDPHEFARDVGLQYNFATPNWKPPGVRSCSASTDSSSAT